ncbi:TerB family tellurite resistance protein [Paracoccus sp. SSK6]|uniref:tellurite resistance TerB family protein n=1 Tax=Paracoccus sp. SSK6 TaxID=3143131 RepID=UPI00321BD47C
MFRNLLNRLFSEDRYPKPLATEDAEIAVAALLVRVARADDHYNAAEKARIDQVLAQLHGLGMADAAERRSAAEMIEAEAPDTVRFTRLIKDRVSLEDRTAIIGAMWEISLADNHRAANEETAIRLVAGLLGVTDRDSALQRQRVAGAR